MQFDILIPLWFLGFDSVIYFLYFIGCSAISVFAIKAFKLTYSNRHLMMFLGFLILGLAFLSLSISSGYSYFVLKSCTQICHFDLFDSALHLMDVGYWMYFILSIIAYIVFVIMYSPDRREKVMAAALPTWFLFFYFFHLIAIVLLLFVVLMAFRNYMERKTQNSLCVFIMFLSLLIFHTFLFLVGFHEIVYFIAHLSLITGFACMFNVLRKVGRR